MQEEQLKPIEEQTTIEPIMPLPSKTEQVQNKEQTEIIKELPTWSIEPPIEIKRGNL